MKLKDVLSKIDQVGRRLDIDIADIQALSEAIKHLSTKFPSVEDVRPIFDSKMKMVEEKTGRNVMMSLTMKAGPDDAKPLYEQMFMCFYSGFCEN
jgi:hypothetical protein